MSAMAGFLTYGNKKYAPLDAKMRELLPGIYSTMKDLVPYVDHDAAAFGDYMVKFVCFLGSWLLDFEVLPVVFSFRTWSLWR